MRTNGLRIAALLLTFLLFLQGWIPAAATNDDPLVIPDTWAHDALVFAVDNGILSGKGSLGLCPTDKATRAELASMLVRILGAKPQEAPLPFTDCKEGAWYYDDISAAYSMGMLYGTSDTTVSPTQNITREQAFTVIARAFRLSGGDTKLLQPFSDRNKIAAYAVDAMATLVQLGYLAGTEQCLNPKKNISRQELAQVLYVLLNDICRDKVADKGEYQNLLFSAVQPIPAGTVIHGDLVIPCDAAPTLTLTDVTVEGRLLVLGEAVILGGSFSTVELYASCTLSGTAGKLLLLHDGIAVDFSGTAASTEISASDTVLSGTGNAGEVTNRGFGTEITCQLISYIEQLDAGLAGLSLTQTHIPIASFTDRTVRLAVHFDEVDETFLYGVPAEGRHCTLSWSIGGKLLASTKDFILKKGADAEQKISIPFRRDIGDTVSVLLTVSYGTEEVSFPLLVRVDNRLTDLYYAAVNIPTIHVHATMLYDCTASNGTALKRGDTVYYMGGSGYVQIPGGKFTYVPAGSFRIIDKVYYNNSVTYSQEVVEAFVNLVHNYASPTDYLIWCNLYSEHVYVFKGSAGNWTLLTQSSCSSGSNYSPTRPGVYSIYNKSYRWDFGDYYVLYPSLFDGGIAFHTRTVLPDNSGWLDARLGYTISHGCVRVTNEVAKYIFDNCPISTTVVVW